MITSLILLPKIGRGTNILGVVLISQMWGGRTSGVTKGSSASDVIAWLEIVL